MSLRILKSTIVDRKEAAVFKKFKTFPEKGRGDILSLVKLQ